VVAELRSAGAVLLGKTRTAVFASFDPAATTNPKAPSRTPGGSSSGSAAAVAAGMTPFALGSQTLGSVLRPASFCGVAGFKPTFGLIPTDGMLRFAPSLDTVGLFTETAADMELLWRRGFGGEPTATLGTAARLPVPAGPEMEAAFEDAVARLRAAGLSVDDVDLPAGFSRLVEAAYTVNEYEGARSLESRWREHGNGIGVKLAALVERGLAIPAPEYEAAIELIHSMETAFAGLLWEYPLILTPAATGPAPEGLESTGDPAANAPWTALGVPAISIPMPVEGPPLGIQAVGAWGRDDAVVSVSAQLEQLLYAGGI